MLPVTYSHHSSQSARLLQATTLIKNTHLALLCNVGKIVAEAAEETPLTLIAEVIETDALCQQREGKLSITGFLFEPFLRLKSISFALATNTVGGSQTCAITSFLLDVLGLQAYQI